MKKIITFIFLSSFLLASCSSMPDWVQNLNPWVDENKEKAQESS